MQQRHLSQTQGSISSSLISRGMGNSKGRLGIGKLGRRKTASRAISTVKHLTFVNPYVTTLKSTENSCAEVKHGNKHSASKVTVLQILGQPKFLTAVNMQLFVKELLYVR